MPLLSLLELALFYWRRVLFVLIFFPAVAFIVSSILLANAPIYVASAKVSVLPTNSQLAFANEFVRGSPQQPANLISMTHMENLISRPISSRTVDVLLERRRQAGEEVNFEPTEPTGLKRVRREIRSLYNRLNSGKHYQPDQLTETISTLQGGISVELIEGTYLMKISVAWDDPDLAAEITNTLSEVYVEELRSEANERNTELESFVAKQMLDPAAGPAERAAMQNAIIALRLGSTNARGNLRVVEPAVPPVYPASPKVVLNTIVALAFSMALIAFTIVALDTFSKKMMSLAHLKQVFQERALGPVVGAQFLKKLGLHNPSKAITNKIDLLGLKTGGEILVYTIGSNLDTALVVKELKQHLKEYDGEKGWIVTPIGPASSKMNKAIALSTSVVTALAIPRNVYTKEEVETVVGAFGAGGSEVLGFYTTQKIGTRKDPLV